MRVTLSCHCNGVQVVSQTVTRLIEDIWKVRLAVEVCRITTTLHNKTRHDAVKNGVFVGALINITKKVIYGNWRTSSVQFNHNIAHGGFYFHPRVIVIWLNLRPIVFFWP